MKRERAYVDSRRNRIIELLETNPQIKVEELANKLDVSAVTVRRDLQYLEERKLVKRFYGGATLLDGTEQGVDKVALSRRLISQYAARFVEGGDTIFINTSATALDMIRYIDKSNVVAITNNGKAINCKKSDGVSIILTGGELRFPKEAMVGDFALNNLQNIFAKKAFIGCSGMSAQKGMMTEVATEVNINRLMAEHAMQEVYILADHTKIGHNSSFISFGVNMVNHLITDEYASQDELEAMAEQGVIIHIAKRENF